MKYLKLYERWDNSAEKKAERMDNLSKYLSAKFGKTIIPLGGEFTHAIFKFDEKRILKIDHHGSIGEFELQHYIKAHPELPVAKVYEVGYIHIPLKLQLNVDPNKHKKKTEFIIIEKVDITSALIKDLKTINYSSKELSKIIPEIAENELILMLTSNLINKYITLDRKYNNTGEVLQKMINYFNNTNLATTYNRLVEIFTILSKHDIKWADIHPYQFGINQKGKIVAFDIDGFYGSFDFKTNNYIREHTDFYETDNDYDYEDDTDFEYDETFGKYKGNNIFYHGTTDKRLIGTNGIHIGSYQAAKEALEARIGVPAEGEWDGAKKYGETLIAGRNKLKQLEKKDIYCATGYNSGSDVPEEDYYPTTRPEKHWAKYSDKTPIPFNSYPIIFKVKVIGNMEPIIVSDVKANDLGNNPYSSKGYYYSNVGEDSGSISAVVPNNKWLKIL